MADVIGERNIHTESITRMNINRLRLVRVGQTMRIAGTAALNIATIPAHAIGAIAAGMAVAGTAGVTRARVAFFSSRPAGGSSNNDEQSPLNNIRNNS